MNKENVFWIVPKDKIYLWMETPLKYALNVKMLHSISLIKSQIKLHLYYLI